ncbi:ATP-binding protein [Streptomyces sioyaensis]|uniref:ATP-binding protein n=1 Tax=Streptomyces sioyaensis TaxID=67364 RepID=UPI0037D67E1B
MPAGTPRGSAPAAHRRVRHFVGPAGVGKTHAAQALGHLAIRWGTKVRFATSRPDLPGRRPRRPHLGPPTSHPPSVSSGHQGLLGAPT